MDRAFQRSHSLMLRGTFYSVPPISTEYGRGIDNGRYPTPRTVLFGLSVSF